MSVYEDAECQRPIAEPIGPGQFLGEVGLLLGEAVYATARVDRGRGGARGAGRAVPRAHGRRHGPRRDRPERVHGPARDGLRARDRAPDRRVADGPRRRPPSRVRAAELPPRPLARPRDRRRRGRPRSWPSTGGRSRAWTRAVRSSCGGRRPSSTTRRSATSRASSGSAASRTPTASPTSSSWGRGRRAWRRPSTARPRGSTTVLLDEIGAGGQAGSSSRIENYLGFPAGLSGTELATRATLQARKFGARFVTPRRAAALRRDGDGYAVGPRRGRGGPRPRRRARDGRPLPAAPDPEPPPVRGGRRLLRGDGDGGARVPRRDGRRRGRRQLGGASGHVPRGAGPRACSSSSAAATSARA